MGECSAVWTDAAVHRCEQGSFGGGANASACRGEQGGEEHGKEGWGGGGEGAAIWVGGVFSARAELSVESRSYG